MSALLYGDRAAREVSQRLAAPVTTIAALKAMGASQRADGQCVVITADNSRWIFSLASAVTGDDVLVITPTAGSGRWLRMPGYTALTLPFTFATADAAVLYTMPTGALFHIEDLNWRVTADFTGGSASAIGVSSTKTGFSTKGDLLGGSAGDVAAALTAALSPAGGTLGVGLNSLAKLKVALWNPADIIRFDRITNAFTAGAGSVVIEGNLIQNAGA